MKFIKCNTNKIISSSLVASVVILIFFNVVGLLSNSNIYDSQLNSISVQKIDDCNAYVHNDLVKTSRSDFLFCKSDKSNGIFQYDIYDLEKTEKLYEFNSPMDITINDCTSSISKLGAGVWALASGATGAGALGATAGILGGVGAAGTAAAGVSAIASAGATSAAAGIGWAAGAQVAGAIILSAAGPGLVIAGAGALAGLG